MPRVTSEGTVRRIPRDDSWFRPAVAPSPDENPPDAPETPPTQAINLKALFDQDSLRQEDTVLMRRVTGSGSSQTARDPEPETMSLRVLADPVTVYLLLVVYG
jgi:hypothetical protein